jgi:hypothetical protein
VIDGCVATCGGATSRAPVVVGGSEASPAIHMLLQSGSVLILPFFAGSESLFPF